VKIEALQYYRAEKIRYFMKKIQRLEFKSDLYRNFKLGFLGASIDKRFLNKENDFDEDEVSSAFDFGFVIGIEKIKYEAEICINQFERGEIVVEDLIDQIKNLFDERIEVAYCRSQNVQKSIKMKAIISKHKNRISDDL